MDTRFTSADYILIEFHRRLYLLDLQNDIIFFRFIQVFLFKALPEAYKNHFSPIVCARIFHRSLALLLDSKG
jgi:hypothetical protein